MSSQGSKFSSLVDVRRGTAAARGDAPKRRGRPAGKRSNPDYRQVTIYIRRDTHQDVKIALEQDKKQGKGQEISELAQTLFAQWLVSRRET